MQETPLFFEHLSDFVSCGGVCVHVHMFQKEREGKLAPVLVVFVSNLWSQWGGDD